MGCKTICTFVLAMAGVFLLLNARPVQSLGVTRPMPYDIQLMVGETAGFTFQIQSTTSLEDQSCVVSISGLDPLVIEIEELEEESSEILVPAGSIKNVYGKVTAPLDVGIQTYSGKLHVSCASAEAVKGGGSMVRMGIGGTPMVIKVVENRTRPIRTVKPPEEEGPQPVDYSSIIISAAVIIIVAAGVYYWRRKSKKKK
jgi:hypothetical protein